MWWGPDRSGENPDAYLVRVMSALLDGSRPPPAVVSISVLPRLPHAFESILDAALDMASSANNRRRRYRLRSWRQMLRLHLPVGLWGRIPATRARGTLGEDLSWGARGWGKEGACRVRGPRGAWPCQFLAGSAVGGPAGGIGGDGASRCSRLWAREGIGSGG